MVGSDQYLTKPFTQETLIEVIQQHVHSKATISKPVVESVADVD